MAQKKWYYLQVVASNYGEKVTSHQAGALAAKILNDWEIKPEDCKPLGFNTSHEGFLGVDLLIYSDKKIPPFVQLGVSNLES